MNDETFPINLFVLFQIIFKTNPPRFIECTRSSMVKLHTPPRKCCFDQHAAHILPIIISLPSPVFVIGCSWNNSSHSDLHQGCADKNAPPLFDLNMSDSDCYSSVMITVSKLLLMRGDFFKLFLGSLLLLLTPLISVKAISFILNFTRTVSPKIMSNQT